MAAPPPVVPPALELEDPELGAAEVLEHLGGEARSRNERPADRDPVAVGDHQHLLEPELAAGLPGKARDLDHLVQRHLSLNAVDVHDRVHRELFSASGCTRTGRAPRREDGPEVTQERCFVTRAPRGCQGGHVLVIGSPYRSPECPSPVVSPHRGGPGCPGEFPPCSPPGRPRAARLAARPPPARPRPLRPPRPPPARPPPPAARYCSERRSCSTAPTSASAPRSSSPTSPA